MRYALGFPSDAPTWTSGKRPYRTEQEARHALGAARAARRKADPNGTREIATFLCRGCGWHHVTGKPFHARRSFHARRQGR